MFRRLLKDLAPPLVLDHLRAGRPYRSWEAAKAAAGSYADPQLNRFKIARSAARVADGSILESSVLGLVIAAAGKAELAVTDLGGATGDLGADVLAAFPNVQYTVVENETMVDLMSDQGPIRFAASVPPTCDIFFTSGTLQYLDDPRSAIAAGLASASHAAIFVRNSFSETELFRVQRSRLFENGGGPIPAGFSNVLVSVPHRTVSERLLVDMAEKNSFPACSSYPRGRRISALSWPRLRQSARFPEKLKSGAGK